MLEDWPITVPTNRSARTVSNDQRLHEFIGPEFAKVSRTQPKRIKPVRNRVGRRKSACFKIVAPAKAAGEALAGPLLEAEWSEVRGVDLPGQLSLFVTGDDVVGQFQAGQDHPTEQIRREVSVLCEPLSGRGTPFFEQFLSGSEVLPLSPGG